VGADDETAVLELLVTERDGAGAEATRLRNQLHQLLLQGDPEYRAHLPALRTRAGVAALEQYPAPSPRPLDQERAAAVRRLAQRLRLALAQAEDLAEQIRRRAQARFALLTGLCGVSLLTAGALAGILGPGRRFRTDAQLAAYAGVAPLEASSAGRVRHRLNRGGNRRLNAILHRMAIAQARSSPAARAYLARRESEGRTRREAIR
jgi:transposase